MYCYHTGPQNKQWLFFSTAVIDSRTSQSWWRSASQTPALLSFTQFDSCESSMHGVFQECNPRECGWFNVQRSSPYHAVNTLCLGYKSQSVNAVSIYLNGKLIPQETSVKYLGIHLDRRLTWTPHIHNKRKQLGLMLNRMYWIIGRKSKLSLTNKLLIYKAILQLFGHMAFRYGERHPSQTLRYCKDYKIKSSEW